MKHSTSKNNTLLSQVGLEQIVCSLPCYVYWKDTNYAYVGCNQLTAELFDLTSPSDINGLTDYDLFQDKDLIDGYRVIDRKIVEQGESQLNVEEKMLMPNGDVIYILVNKVPLYDDLGQVIGILGISTDITLQKQAEIEIQANKSKSYLLTAIDRLIRNPLSAILSTGQVLQRQNINQEMKQEADVIVDSAKSITPLLDRMQYYLDLEDGLLNNIERNFNLRKFLDQYTTQYEELAEKKGLTFNHNFDKNMPEWVYCGSHFLSQILHTLLANAIKFTIEGSISFRCEITNQTEDNALIKLIVQDTGQGIRSDLAECLFDFFNQRSLLESGKFLGPSCLFYAHSFSSSLIQ